MNARQRRKLTRKWTRLLGEEVDYRDAKLAEAAARHEAHIARAQRAGNLGRLVPRRGCDGRSCWPCGDSGFVWTAAWKHEIEPATPVEAAHREVFGYEPDYGQVPW